jgi:hypothetical protein
MAHYLVRAKPKTERLTELHTRLHENAFVDMRPFGESGTYSLTEARPQQNGTAVWDDSPPSAQELAAMLDTYFDEIKVE